MSNVSSAPPSAPDLSDAQAAQLARDIKQWALALGFNGVGITDTDLSAAEPRLLDWLANRYQGDMDYMAKHGHKRSRPQDLIPGTLRILSLRLDYLPETVADSWQVLENPQLAYIARYAMGRDYHKVMRRKLQQLCARIESQVSSFTYRVFADSAPVMEVALAEKAGLGWRGKHTLLINRQHGSWFFLGEIYTNLPLPTDAPTTAHCGSCKACIDVCPTGAIVAPYTLDARRCISYLTIEHKGAIPEDLRPLIGNRIYGCDDCQLICPWNKFAVPTREADFAVRHGLDSAGLLACFAWTEEQFNRTMAGSAIYRIGYRQWLRNIAVALGNAPASSEIMAALQGRLNQPCNDLEQKALLHEHIHWAMQQQQLKMTAV